MANILNNIVIRASQEAALPILEEQVLQEFFEPFEEEQQQVEESSQFSMISISSEDSAAPGLPYLAQAAQEMVSENHLLEIVPPPVEDTSKEVVAKKFFSIFKQKNIKKSPAPSARPDVEPVVPSTSTSPPAVPATCPPTVPSSSFPAVPSTCPPAVPSSSSPTVPAPSPPVVPAPGSPAVLCRELPASGTGKDFLKKYSDFLIDHQNRYRQIESELKRSAELEADIQKLIKKKKVCDDRFERLRKVTILKQNFFE